MSDYSISIVPKQLIYLGNSSKAIEILDWLIAQDIVLPVLSNCVLSKGQGYFVSDGARNVTEMPDQLPFNCT